MSKQQFNVNLAFSAETGKAKQQIQELQTLLSKIAYQGTTVSSTDQLSTDLRQASEAAKELQFHLNNAFNATTGNFDLSLLDKSLKTSNSNITDLSAKLLSAGQTGQQAFLKLAQSISMADQPMFKINNKLKELGVSLKNAARWQISSNIIHGLQGGIQSAYNYAQDLNKSLNNIRIVTGYNVDKMAEFAEQANKAAKALSTTTTEYTDASLIYFQQGLTDAEVQGRTDTTIKLANVTGQSVEETANQMTAIWNNFDDGSKSLEYYADVITALGAATASSSKEISEGLNKFSAVAESVGLSYEYASAALATVTATTRQSADIVGNAFKTLFARIQGLNLGETLDDGTTLNKYSEALFKVGINIKDQSGQLKDMNTILDEMGNKWSTLDKDQQISLAQTVAGVRQYTQLIALMDNWDYFQQNLGVATDSEGALQKQADIYAGSWEAAEKRVQAAAESIYQSLIDDKFFISINNGFANLLNGIDAFIDGAGGLKTLLLSIGSIVATVFANQVPKALETFKYNLTILTKGTDAAYQKIQSDLAEGTKIAFAKGGIDENSAMGFTIKQANQLIEAKNKLAKVSDQMTEKQRQEAQTTLAIVEALQSETIALKEKNDELKKATSESIKSINYKELDYGYAQGKIAQKAMFTVAKEPITIGKVEGLDPRDLNMLEGAAIEAAKQIREQLVPQLNEAEVATKGLSDSQEFTFDLFKNEGDNQFASGFNQLTDSMNTLNQQTEEVYSQLNKAKESLKGLTEGTDEFNKKNIEVKSLTVQYDTLSGQFEQLQAHALGFIQTLPEGVRELKEVRQAINEVGNAKGPEQLLKSWQNLQKQLHNITGNTENLKKLLKGSIDGGTIDKAVSSMRNLYSNTNKTSSATAQLQKLYNNFNPKAVVSGVQALTSTAAALGNLASIGNQINSLMSSINNPDLSDWEQLSSILMSLSFIVPQTMALFNSLGQTQSWLIGLVQKHLIVLAEETAAIELAAQADAAAAIKKQLVGELTDANIAGLTKEALMQKAVTAAKKTSLTVKEIEVAVDTALNAAKEKGVTLSAAELIALLAEAGGRKVNVEQTKAQVFWQGVLNALTGKWSTLIIAGIGAAIFWLVKLIANMDTAAEKQEKAVKSAQEAQKAYEQQIDKVENLKSELETLGNTVDELLSKDKLSFIEEEELNNTRTEIALLEQQLAYEEAILEAKKQARILDWKENQHEYDNWTDKVENQYWSAPEVIYTEGDESNNNQESWSLGSETAIIDTQQKFNAWWSDYEQYLRYARRDEEWSSEQLEAYIAEAYLDASTRFENGIKQATDYIIENSESYLSDLEGYSLWYESLTDIEKSDPAIQAQITSSQERLKQQGILIYGEEDYYKVANDKFKSSDDYETISNYLASNPYANVNELVQQFSDNFIEILNSIGINASDYAQRLSKQYYNYNNILAKAGGDVNLQSLTSHKDWNNAYLDLLDDIPIKLEDTVDTIINKLINIAKEQIPEDFFDLESWKKQYSEQMSIIKDLETGDIISYEDYAALREEYQQYFQIQIDGTAMLIAKAEELKAAAESVETQVLKDEITENQIQLGSVEKQSGLSLDQAKILLNNLTSGFGNMENNIAQTQSYIDAVEKVYGTEVKNLQEAIALVEEHTAKLVEQESTLALIAESTDELNDLALQGFVGEEAFNATQDLAIMKEIIEEGLDADYILDYAGTLKDSIKVLDEYKSTVGKSVDELEEQEKIAKKIATAHKKMDKGLQDLSDNWEDWTKALDPKKIGTQEYQKGLEGIRNAVSDILDVPIDSLSDEFLTSVDTAKLLQRAINGDLTAIDELRYAAAEDILIKAGMDTTAAKEAITTLQGDMAAIPDLEIGATVDISQALPNLWKLYEEGQITAKDLQGALNSIGWEPNITYKKMTVGEAKAFYQTAQLIGPDGSIETIDLSNCAEDSAIVQVPILTSATYRGSGGSTAQAPTPPSSGGGGGGSTPKHAEKKNDSDKERYHTLQNQLEDLQSEYNSISEAKDRAFGKDKLNNIDKEIQKTDELINKQKEYIDAISADLPVDKAVMDAYYKDLIGGTIQYDERGNISNYDQIQDAMFAKYNQMADLYDEDSEEWQTFEKKYEQLEKYIEQYEETYDLLRDEEETYQELLRQRMDLQLEKIQYAIELKLNIAEDGLAVLDYQMSRIEDNAFKAAEAIGLFSKKAELLYDQMAADREGLNDILGQQLSQAEIIQFYNGDMSVLEGKTFTEAQMDAIKEYRDNLLELNEEFDDIRENIEEQVMEVFDAWNEKLEQGIDKLDHYGNVLESYKNIIDIVGKDTLGLSDAFMATLNQSSIDNAINKVTATKKSYEAMIDAQSQAEQALEEAKARNDEASIKMWEENLQSITEEAQSAREEMLSAWEDALNGIAEQFEATVERVVDTFNKEVYALGGLEGLSEDFSRQQENADIMLDDYQKIYELSKLNRDINKSIDNIDSISGKQKLKKLLEQINKLQEDGVEMSQYDLEYMQKTYDLRMAEIELEEAQRAKNTVRLRKDNEGNWSYVYTQNMDAVDTAQQKYEDALYAMQDVSSNYIDEMSEKLISTSQEMEEALAAIRIQDYANIDDYYAEVQRVQKQYEDELAVQQGELQKAIDNNKILYDKDWTNYHNATGYKISDTQNFATSFRDTLLGSLMGSEEDTANFTNIMSSAVDTLTQGLMQGAEVYYANLQEAMNAAGTSTEDFAKDFEEKIKEIEDKSEESTNKIKDLAKDMSSSLKEITDSVTTWQKTYGEVMQQIVNSNIAVINSFNDMLKALSIDTKSITVKYDILNDADKEPEQYASGGYTGKWGNYGKLAILDEKELILNKDDTVNFLDALGIAKQILDTIDLNALQASYGFGNLVPATINENNSQTIEQDVHITAEFPNATNHNEIEQAFETLINKASQYANRK